MKPEEFESKLEQVLSGELLAALPNMISVIDDGYDVFGLYKIRTREGSCEVYRYDDLRGSFTSVRVALSWCIAEKYQQWALARDIRWLDQEKSVMTQDVRARRLLLPAIKDPVRWTVASDKLDNKEYQLRQVRERLTKCVNLAKYFQLRGFNDEIARTRRPPPNRTAHSSAGKSKRKNA